MSKPPLTVPYGPWMLRLLSDLAPADHPALVDLGRRIFLVCRAEAARHPRVPASLRAPRAALETGYQIALAVYDGALSRARAAPEDPAAQRRAAQAGRGLLEVMMRYEEHYQEAAAVRAGWTTAMETEG